MIRLIADLIRPYHVFMRFRRSGGKSGAQRVQYRGRGSKLLIGSELIPGDRAINEVVLLQHPLWNRTHEEVLGKFQEDDD